MSTAIGVSKPPASSRPRIALIEDDATLALAWRVYLQGRYEVRVYPDGAAALAEDWEEDEPPDVILLDLMMPGVSGWDVTYLLQGQGLAARTVLITALCDDDAQVVQFAEQQGTAGVLYKTPATDLLQRLDEAIQHVLSQREECNLRKCPQ